MPFCPKCRYEYKPSVFTCPDCGEKLVDHLAEESPEIGPERSEDWIPLVRLTSQQLAEMLKEALIAKDIPAVLTSGTGHFGVTGQMGISSFRPVGGGFVIFVPRKFADNAVQEAKIMLGEDWDKSRLWTSSKKGM